jgi:serine protease Do
MRGVDLDVFDFDYDLTWAGVFLNADEAIYGRFGGRDADNPDKYLTTSALREALRHALAAHHDRKAPTSPPRTSLRAEDFPAGRRLSERACIHCHQVYDFRNAERQAAGLWRLDDAWVYPLPENLGLTLDPDHGRRVRSVTPGSAAARGGLRDGDVLLTLHGRTVASFADVQYALHRAPAAGRVAVTWERGGRSFRGEVELSAGWRRTDVSWRASTRRLGPDPVVQGTDLTDEEKQTLGLSASRLAFRPGAFLARAARQAGLLGGDIIIGLNGRALEMTERQFVAHVRLHHQPGDRVTVMVLREGRQVNVPVTLPARVPF